MEQQSSVCLANSLDYGRFPQRSGAQFCPDRSPVENSKADVQTAGLLGRLGSRQERSAGCGTSERYA